MLPPTGGSDATEGGRLGHALLDEPLDERAAHGAFDATVVHNYTSAVKDIAYSRAAVRTLARMPANLADRIRGRVRAYANDPSAQARNVRRLRGPDGFLRLRVGDWRIVMRDADTLEVLHIATRGHAYRD